MPPFRLLLIVGLVLAPWASHAQVDPAIQGGDNLREVDDTPVAKPQPVEAPAEKPVPKKVPHAKPAEAPVAPRPVVPALEVRRVSDADLLKAWQKWKAANAKGDLKGEAQAREDLSELKKVIAGRNLDAFAIGLIRASRLHEEAQDSATAVELARTAVELAPDLPAAQFGLAGAYLAADPSEVGRYLHAFQTGLGRMFADPRYWKPLLGDLGAALLFALLATAIALVAVLAARRIRYFLYDFHFFFPQAASRWQSAVVAVLLLALPWILRLGLVPALLVLFAALSLYLTRAERSLVALLIAALGLVPLAGAWLVDKTAFAGTTTETVWQLEDGGLGADAVAAQVRTKAKEGKASFVELFALGTYEARRGELEPAAARLREALKLRERDPSALTNLANVLFLQGDLENPKQLYEQAAKGNPTLGAPMWNLGQLFRRRVQLKGEAAAGEVDQGNSALGEARLRDNEFAARPEPVLEKSLANSVVAWVPAAAEDLAHVSATPEALQRVGSQLTVMLAGEVSEPLSFIYPAALAFLIFGFGFLGNRLEVAKVCAKCGRPASKRGDPELSPGSLMCGQCVNVFAKKGVVQASIKVRKQIEVARYQTRTDRMSYFLGLLCSGMGHVFKGLPIRGTLNAFVFLFLVSLFILRNGMLRTPYAEPPMWLKVVPVAVVFIVIYLLSLKGLGKKQSS
jgi:tetratricopeptide (TPR) repeat protein